MRAFYSAPISTFLRQSKDEILGVIHSNNIAAQTLIQQSNTWEIEINILKQQLARFSEGRILFEYTISRMGKRIDVVFLYRSQVFLLEFKCGDTQYHQYAYDQVYDYALDLHNFHKESHHRRLVPILISTKAPEVDNALVEYEHIIEPLKCNSNNIARTILDISARYPGPGFNYTAWENSDYLPTPTIIEAAQALYRGHNVKEITRSDANATNLSTTTDQINNIIAFSKDHKRKSICFITGVPGAGKTLVGLNIAVQRASAQQGEHAVFLSGNFPLVTVLQEALARDKVEQSRFLGRPIRKSDALRRTSAFIQIIHRYRDHFVNNTLVPTERIAIFDEAQRAWTLEMIQKFMKTKKGIQDFAMSEPEFLISTMDRHKDWAVIVCLVGGGQEINTGEAGLPEWFESLRRSFRHWDVYITPELNDSEYRRDFEWNQMIRGLSTYERKELHLATSVRSFRSKDVAAFIKALLDIDREQAKKLYQEISSKYPLVMTRSLHTAKQWVKEQSKGTTRYGLLASSGGLRLKPAGIFVKNEIKVANWFLNDKSDVRSSYMLEDVVTEFDIQGLELDYTIVAWDADLRFHYNDWSYHSFIGSRWNHVNDEVKKLYLKNTYRVLLTRARQGLVIFIPEGSSADHTRKQEYYDQTFEYFKSIGITPLD